MSAERLKMWIAYDGTPVAGGQSQRGGNTIQDHLQLAFFKVAEAKIVVHGAGRTDAGVHALRQCAHVDVPRKRLAVADWRNALNANLPLEIRVLQCARAAGDFHARYSTTGKIYTYRVWNAPVLSPFELNRAWHLPGEIDFESLHASAQLICGTHDFAAFAANRGLPPTTTVRTISRAAVKQAGSLITLRFEGDGFLYKMVRLITGTLLQIARGRADPALIPSVLALERKTTFAAPAAGLYLTRVIYGSGSGQKARALRRQFPR